MERAPSPLSMFNSRHDGGDGPDGRRGPMEGTHCYHYKQRQLGTWEEMGGQTGTRGPNRSPPVRQRKPVGQSRSPRSATAASTMASPTRSSIRAETPALQQKAPLVNDASLTQPRPATQLSGRVPARMLSTPQPERAATPAGRLLTPLPIAHPMGVLASPVAGSIRNKGRKGGIVVSQGMSTVKRPLRNRFAAPSCTESPLAPTASRSNGISESDLCNTWFHRNQQKARPVSQEFSSKAPAPKLGLTRTGMRDYMSLSDKVGTPPAMMPRSRKEERRQEEKNEECKDVSALDDWKELAQSEITLLTQGILTKYKMGKWIPDAETVWDYHLEKKVDMENDRVKKEAERLDQLDQELEEEQKGRRSSLYDRLQCQPEGLTPEQYLATLGTRRSLGQIKKKPPAEEKKDDLSMSTVSKP